MTFAAGLERLRMFGGARFVLVRSSGWAMAEYVAYPVMMLAAMPLYLWALGTLQYGQWMLLLTITGFGGLAGLGMGPTATRTVAVAAGRGDMVAASDGARACLAITLVSAVALAGLILIAGWMVGDEVFAKVGTRREILMIVGFAAFLLTLEQVDSVFAGILRGLERFDLSARLEIGGKMAQVICTAIVAWQTRSLHAVFLMASVIAAARTAAKIVAAQRELSIRWLLPNWAPREIRTAFEFGKWIWLQSAGSLMFAVADRALIGAMLGAQALALYSIGLQLTQQIQSVPAAGSQVVFPAISKRQAAGIDWHRLALRASGLVAALGMAGAVVLLLFGDWFLTLWIGPRLATQVSPLLPWLALAYALLALPSGPQYVLMGMGRARLIATLTILAGTTAIAITPWAIANGGLIGASAGRIGYALVMLALVPAMFWTMRQERTGRTDL